MDTEQHEDKFVTAYYLCKPHTDITPDEAAEIIKSLTFKDSGQLAEWIGSLVAVYTSDVFNAKVKGTARRHFLRVDRETLGVTRGKVPEPDKS